MKRVLVGAAVVAAGVLGASAQPAAASSTCERPKLPQCEAVDSVVGVVEHATWQLLGDVLP